MQEAISEKIEAVEKMVRGLAEDGLDSEIRPAIEIEDELEAIARELSRASRKALEAMISVYSHRKDLEIRKDLRAKDPEAASAIGIPDRSVKDIGASDTDAGQ